MQLMTDTTHEAPDDLVKRLRGTRPPTGKILDHLGLKAQTVYIKNGENT